MTDTYIDHLIEQIKWKPDTPGLSHSTYTGKDPQGNTYFRFCQGQRVAVTLHSSGIQATAESPKSALLWAKNKERDAVMNKLRISEN